MRKMGSNGEIKDFLSSIQKTILLFKYAYSKLKHISALVY